MKYTLLFAGFITIFTSCSTSTKLTKLQSRDTVNLVTTYPKIVKIEKVQPFSVQPDLIRSATKFQPYYSSSQQRKTVKRSASVIYKKRGYYPLWLTSRGPKDTFKELINQLKSIPEHGLEESAYKFSQLQKDVRKVSSDKFSADELAALDYALTTNYLLLNYHIVNGRFDPHYREHLWYKSKEGLEFLNELSKVQKGKQLKKYFKRLLPPLNEYDQLVNYLAFYKDIEEKGGWNKIPFYDVEVIEPDSHHELIPAIRRRLLITDPMSKKSEMNSLHYDRSLQSAVKVFQQRHGLEVDGRIGKATLAAMNVPVEEKINKITLNLERLRWLPRDFTNEFLLVNIPGYELNVYKNFKPTLNMKVIVGKEYTSTPVFSDTLRYLVFSPTWTVPYSIKSEEMLPRLKKDAKYYTGRTYKFYRGWSTTNEIDPSSIDWTKYSEDNFPFNIVQQPGPANALGLVKFIMPNNLSIYLHDTPTDYLFARTDRALSHGCIRVAEPAELARYLLKDHKSWTRSKINEFMHKDEPKRVYLKKPYHVQLAYLTAYVDRSGKLNFREDIYGHDADQWYQFKTIASKN